MGTKPLRDENMLHLLEVFSGGSLGASLEQRLRGPRLHHPFQPFKVSLHSRQSIAQLLHLGYGIVVEPQHT